jgi:hypothetical protein
MIAAHNGNNPTFFSASPGFFVLPLASSFFCGLSFSGFYSQRTMPFHPLIAGVMVAAGG